MDPDHPGKSEMKKPPSLVGMTLFVMAIVCVFAFVPPKDSFLRGVCGLLVILGVVGLIVAWHERYKIVRREDPRQPNR